MKSNLSAYFAVLLRTLCFDERACFSCCLALYSGYVAGLEPAGRLQHAHWGVRAVIHFISIHDKRRYDASRLPVHKLLFLLKLDLSPFSRIAFSTWSNEIMNHSVILMNSFSVTVPKLLFFGISKTPVSILLTQTPSCRRAKSYLKWYIDIWWRDVNIHLSVRLKRAEWTACNQNQTGNTNLCLS